MCVCSCTNHVHAQRPKEEVGVPLYKPGISLQSSDRMIILFLALKSAGDVGTCSQLSIYVGSGDVNSHCHACVSSTLTSEPSSLAFQIFQEPISIILKIFFVESIRGDHQAILELMELGREVLKATPE